MSVFFTLHIDFATLRKPGGVSVLFETQKLYDSDPFFSSFLPTKSAVFDYKRQSVLPFGLHGQQLS